MIAERSPRDWKSFASRRRRKQHARISSRSYGRSNNDDNRSEKPADVNSIIRNLRKVDPETI